MADSVLYEVRGGVAVITMNRPDRLNALGRDMRQGLFAAWDRFEKDPSAKVAILTGAGDKAFCVGMDLKEASDQGLTTPPPLPVLGDTVQVSKPTIAAVNGYAMAGGWLMAQMCDLCVAADHAVFAITEAKVGRGMPWAPPLAFMLPQRVTMELLLTGDPIGARRLYDLGYINKAVPGAGLMAEASALADRIAGNAPLTVRAARETVYLSTETGRTAALKAAAEAFDPVYRSEDAVEGPRAFAEKRPPVWKGK